MRIGVVCEGPTDFYAISFFLGHSLECAGVDAEFRAIQPEIDKTQPEGGWGNVLLWLGRNPASVRVQQYFSGGLFGGSLSADVLDCLIVQLDTDILEDESFRGYVSATYQYDYDVVENPNDRADVVSEILRRASGFSDMTEADVGRHVIAPAVESTEAWCVAAFSNAPQNFELLRGQVLRDQFMSALERFEGRNPTLPYNNIDKTPKRRKKFCANHCVGSNRIINGCAQFSAVHERLRALAG